MITEASIKSAIKATLASDKKSSELRDGGDRGSGRLALIIRVYASVVDGVNTKTATTEWYAVWHRSGRRRMSKIGNYPKVGLAAARKAFRDNFSRHIELGEDPTGPRARRDESGITVKNLFEAYVGHLKATEAASARSVERALLGPEGDGGASKSIGPDRIAGSVTADDITPLLKQIYGRGSVYMADHMRGMIAAAFSFGIKSRNDYRHADAPDWGIKVNPAAYIPAAEKNPGQRYLSPAEFRSFWKWLESRDNVSAAAPAVRVMLACGQRITEILRVTEQTYESAERIIDWSKTKNGKQHAIPLPKQAADIFEKLTANQFGLYFPGRTNPKVPLGRTSVLGQINTYIKGTGAQPFTARDLRRTWKTLSGAAGIPKDIRDRIQNHAKSDVSSRHYDRWDYMAEKRAAMARWSDFLGGILSGDVKNDAVTLEVAAEAAADDAED